MHLVVRSYLFGMMMVTAILYGLGVTGIVAAGGPSEALNPSVRDSPGSFRPSYSSRTGWHSPTTSTGGGFSSGK